MPSDSDWKTLDITSFGHRELVIIRRREEGLVDWCIEPFHSAIYKVKVGRWLRVHQDKVAHLSEALLQDVDLAAEVFPSRRIVLGRQKSQSNTRGSEPASNDNDGLTGTMATPTWLLLYLLLPNCICNAKSRMRKPIATQALHMIGVLTRIAYEGHSAASATGSSGPALHTKAGSATVCADGTLTMDSKLTTWNNKSLELASDGNSVADVHIQRDSVAGVLWLWSRIIMTHRVRGLNVTGDKMKTALKLVSEVLHWLQLGLSKWAMKQDEPCTAQMIAMQRAGRRTHPGILTRLSKMNRKSKTVQAWKELGLAVDTSGRSLCKRNSAQYMWILRKMTVGSQKTIWQPKRRKRHIGIGRRNKEEPLGKRCRTEESQASPLASGEKRQNLVAEIIFDSTHFASKDIQVNLVYCPIPDIAAYVPPMSLRHIRWRTAEPGEELSEQDWEQFHKSGFRTRARMESYDCIKYLNHIVEVAFAKGLTAFKCPASLLPMEAGSVRIYNQACQQWYRVSAEDRLADPSTSASGVDASILGVPELPNELLDPCKVNVLLATLDQKQSQWTAMHCCTSAKGLNLMFLFRSDGYHRSWRDMQWAQNHAKGGFQHSSCQLNYALNVNYQQGFFLAKREEVKKEWEVMFPQPGPKFQSLYHNMALDARVSPSTSGVVSRALYIRHVLDNKSYEQKGVFLKQCSWYSIIKLLNEVDTVWHARKYMAEEVANMLLKSKSKKAKEQACAVADQILAFMQNPSDSGVSKVDGKEAHKAEMRALRKRVGNALLLAPRLMTAGNLLNARIMLLIARLAWTEQSWWSQMKTTPQQDREITVKYALGLGEALLKKMWKDALFRHIELHRLGWKIVENAPVTDFESGSGEVLNVSALVPERLMSFLCHFFEARWWSYAWMRFALPEGFAAVLAEGEQGMESLQFLRTLWDAAILAETITNTGHPSAAGVISLRQEIYWLDWPVVQWILRLMSHFLWAPHTTVVNLLMTLFLRLGDTLCIEETHRIGRCMEKRDQQADVLDLLNFFAELMTEKTPLVRRGVSHVRPSEAGAYVQTGDSKPPVPWNRACCTEAPIPLPDGMRVAEKMEKGTFETRNPASGRPSIAAAQALVHLYRHDRLSLAGNMWHCLTLIPHSVVRSAHDVFLVMAQGKFAARAWRGSPLASGAKSGGRRWGFNINYDLVWIFTEDILEWHSIDVQWVGNLEDVETYGFVAVEATSAEPDVPVIVEALIQRGPHKLRQEDRKKLIRLATRSDSHSPSESGESLLHGPIPPVSWQGNLPAELFFIQHHMQGHPREEEYIKRLEKWHAAERKKRSRKPKAPADGGKHSDTSSASSTSSDDGDEVNNALTFVALDNMDESNRSEWIKEKK